MTIAVGQPISTRGREFSSSTTARSEMSPERYHQLSPTAREFVRIELIRTHSIEALAELEPGYEKYPLGLYERPMGHWIRIIVESDQPIIEGLPDSQSPFLAQLRRTIPHEEERTLVEKLRKARLLWEKTQTHDYITEGFESDGHYNYKADRLNRAIQEDVVFGEEQVYLA